MNGDSHVVLRQCTVRQYATQWDNCFDCTRWRPKRWAGDGVGGNPTATERPLPPTTTNKNQPQCCFDLVHLQWLINVTRCRNSLHQPHHLYHHQHSVSLCTANSLANLNPLAPPASAHPAAFNSAWTSCRVDGVSQGGAMDSDSLKKQTICLIKFLFLFFL